MAENEIITQQDPQMQMFAQLILEFGIRSVCKQF